MPQKSQAAIATKIKKWVETAFELSSNYTGLAIAITRLTSIKSFCKDVQAAEKFALYISKLVLQQASIAECPDSITDQEWELHKTLMTDAIAQMENFLEWTSPDINQSLWGYLKQINHLLGDNYRRVHGTTIHFVRSSYLLKLEYAICRVSASKNVANCTDI